MSVSADPPRGFVVTADTDGSPVILYRTRGAGCAAVLTAGWLVGWTFGCVWMTYHALSAPAGVDVPAALFVVPFWAANLFVAGSTAWYFLSVARFAVGPEVLVAERSLWRIRRRREFVRGEVTAVLLVEHSGEEADTRPGWGLAVVGRTEVRVLTHQPRAQVVWLGSALARWAGVTLGTRAPAEARYEVL